MIHRLASLLFLLLAACAGADSAGPENGPVVLVYATPYAPTHPFSRADIRWMEYVEEASGGSLQVRPIWSGGLLSAKDSLEELRHGVADIGLITPIYVRGGVHLIRVQSGFYSGVETIENQVALYRCLAAHSDQIQKEMEGLKVLAVQGGNLPWIITRERAVRSLDDLKGLRIRAPTELLNLLETLGADPVNMPMGDVYSALAKGVLDGVVAPADTFKSLHFADVAGYALAMSVPRGAYPARAMGEKAWNNLSAGHQAILESSIEIWESALAEENRAALEEGETLAAQENVEVFRISDEEQDLFERIYLEEAEHNALALSRYDIDGAKVFRLARDSISGDGTIICAGENS
ncbi:TRAP transporter substrate-binding protein DctP [Hyphococcus sp.]|uniref:TRAP transporter substrate-binding protein DctP n=1 Tax=Hyphococcus sp. TaxID=2038636 RepID=UPI0035C71D48